MSGRIVTKGSIIADINRNLRQGLYKRFFDAVSNAIAAYRYEQELKADDGWQKKIDDCDRALLIYENQMKDIGDKIADELYDQGLDKFAEALISGDYSGFASRQPQELSGRHWWEVWK